MPIAGVPSSLPSTSAQSTKSFTRLTREQWLSCLAATDQDEQIDAAARAGGSDPLAAAAAHYHLAIALARASKRAEAIRHAQEAVAQQPDAPAFGRLLFKLLVAEAAAHSQRQEWTALADVLTQAVACAPADGSGTRSLERFGSLLPLGLLRSGRRGDAAAHWHRRLKSNPADTGALHGLALLAYWWAIHDDANPTDKPIRPWKPAIAYWTALVHSEPFWREWRTRRQQAWGVEVDAGEFSSFRWSLLDERLHHFLRDRAVECSAQQREEEAQRYERYLAMALREHRAGECWHRARTLLQSIGYSFMSPCLSIAAGYLFFEQFHALKEIADATAALAKAFPDDPCVVQLRILFSERGLGLIAVTIDERQRPDRALTALDRLPEQIDGTVEAQYLRAKALLARANGQIGLQQFDAAFRDWEHSHLIASTAQRAAATPRPFVAPFAELVRDVVATMASAVAKRAIELKADDALDEAVTLLERAYRMAPESELRDHLCICLCDRGDARQSRKDNAAARQDFERALALNPTYARARSDMAVLLNNEAVAIGNNDRAIALYEQALEYDPDSEKIKHNLAIAWDAKGVRLLNEMSQFSRQWDCDRAIDAFRKAARLLNPRVDSDTLRVIETIGATNPDDLDTMLANADDDLRTALKHLAIAVQRRRALVGL